jgi:hypothetical protein
MEDYWTNILHHVHKQISIDIGQVITIGQNWRMQKKSLYVQKGSLNINGWDKKLKDRNGLL